VLAGLDVTPELLREILAEARASDSGHPWDTSGRVPVEGSGAPTSSPWVRRGNVPEDLTSFVGRERECAEVGRLLRDGRLVMLLGPAGIGKTRLVLRVAAELTDRFLDGVWLVELAALTEPILVPQAVAWAVGIPEQRGQAFADTLVESLARRHALLVLDNCEYLVGASAAMTGHLLTACPPVRILATSREPLRVPERLSAACRPSLSHRLPAAWARRDARTG
jgi:hypothetical protein